MAGWPELELSPRTPADVLAEIQDQVRHGRGPGRDAEPVAEVSFATTVAAWRRACRLPSRRSLPLALNRIWGIHASDAEWRLVLTPRRTATLEGVCELVVRKGALRPQWRPALVGGTPSAEEGAFRALRRLLAEGGLAQRPIWPTTGLARLARQDLDALVRQTGRLAPGVLPVPRIVRHPLEILSLCAGLVGCALVVLGPFVGIVEGLVLAVALEVFAFSALHLVGRLELTRVDFGGLRTVGDLARAVASRPLPA